MSDRKYLKDVLPRLYRETEAWLIKINRPDLLEQLPHLFIVDRCDCGQCSAFYMDSDIPRLSREGGSTLLLRPLYYDMDNGFMLGVSGADGLTIGDHTESYVSSFEMMGGDYRDNYIHKQLQANGFKISKKLKKRFRPGTHQRRQKKRRIGKYRGSPINPLTPSGKYLKKRTAMARHWKYRIY